MSFIRLLPRGRFLQSPHLRPTSQRFVHTESATSPSCHPTANTTIGPHKVAPMPKKIRLPEAYRYSPIQGRQRNGPFGANMREGPSFQEMAEARIAILETALKQIALHPEVEDTEKKIRKRDKRLSQHKAEIQNLKRQMQDGPDPVIERPARSKKSLTAPKEPEVGAATRMPTKAERAAARRQGMELPHRPANHGEKPIDRYQPPARRSENNSDRTFQPHQGPARDSPQTLRPGWRPGHIDEPVVLAKPGTPDKAGRRDEIQAPSAESGGVPEPSNAYIKQALLPPRIAPEPRHILIIIDLNGALIHRPDRKKPTLYIARNSADRFLEYLFSRFKVMVWSAARPNNVDLMCQQLFPGSSRKQVVAEWARDKMGLSVSDYNARTQVYKRLETVWKNKGIQACHPMRNYGGRWDQTNTVLIDDSAEKGRSHPFNLIKVPEFEGQEESEDVLKKVAEYLDDLLVQEDVSAYIQKKPFRFEESQDQFGRERR